MTDTNGFTQNRQANDASSYNKLTAAQQRWKILADALRGKSSKLINGTAAISVRRFQTFGLVNTELLSQDSHHKQGSEETSVWFKYTCPSCELFRADIRHLVGKVELERLIEFNNTGNVCVWPSEEILTYYCLQKLESFRQKSVCELGGGMTCLAGVALAVCSDVNDVLLTDGNEMSIDNCNEIIKTNKPRFGDTEVTSRLIRWNEHDELADISGTFDCIICADCLFFDDCRKDLLITIDILLKPGGEVIIFAPRRGDTFQQFADLAQKENFEVEQSDDYDALVTKLHMQNASKGLEVYDENLHYPRFMKLKKKIQSEDDTSQ